MAQMQNYQQYDNNGNPIKKPFQIKIAGFTFGKGHIIALIIVVTIVLISSLVSSHNADKEQEERAAEAQKRINEALAKAGTGDNTSLDIHEQIQMQLREQFGNPPEGFEWGYTGELIALGNDDGSTAEDVVYMFVRALSILDFSTAERYSEDSVVVQSYQDYYGIVANSITNYYDNFKRKQFKTSLTTLEVENIKDVAVFSDGTEFVTLQVAALDLQDKDFWREDEMELYETLRVYKDTEEDEAKLEQYVYNYILDCYEAGKIGKRSYTIELVVGKDNGAGWLITGDKELGAILTYENGVNTARYILDNFNDWYMDVTLEEQIETIQQQVQEGINDSAVPDEATVIDDSNVNTEVDNISTEQEIQ